MHTIESTAPIYSERSIFDLVEKVLLSFQKRNVEEFLKCFSEDIEYRQSPDLTTPIVGIENLQTKIEGELDEIESFGFKIKLVLWDPVLKMASAIVEYETISNGTGQRVYENFILTIENKKISRVISTFEILKEW